MQPAGRGRIQNAAATTCSVQQSHQEQQAGAQVSRRAALLSLSAAPLLALVQPAHADTLQLTEYADGPDEFTLQVPENWVTGEGQAAGAKFGGSTGARRALAW